MAKDAYYFSHDSNARNDDKILKLRSKFGYEGYGMFWAIIEVLRESSNYKFELNNIRLLQLSLGCSARKLQSFIEFCLNIGILAKDNQFFWSERLLKSTTLFNKKKAVLSEIGKKANESRWNRDSAKDSVTVSASDPIKLKKSKENKIKLNGINEITLLFDLLNYDEDKLNDSVISRTQNLIDQFSYQKVHEAFLKVSELEDQKKNIAYISKILENGFTSNKPSKSTSPEPQTQWKDLTPTYEEYIRDERK